MKIRSVVASANIVFMILLVQAAAAAAAEVKVIAGSGMSTVLGELGPQFEHTTGHKLLIQYGASGSLKRQIEAGEAFDVAILPSAMIDDLIKQDRIAAGTRAEIGRVGMAVGVRSGAPEPDISSAEAFKRALLYAKSVTYAPEGATGIHLAQVFDRLGIAEQMKAKTKVQQAAPHAAQAVADGEAELAFATTINFLSVRGVELAGLFPPELQNWLVITAGVSAAAAQPDAARALIKHLTTPNAAGVIKAKGLEPVAR
jgi:molybdate transport system substrate-binding protein